MLTNLNIHLILPKHLRQQPTQFPHFFHGYSASTHLFVQSPSFISHYVIYYQSQSNTFNALVNSLLFPCLILMHQPPFPSLLLGDSALTSKTHLSHPHLLPPNFHLQCTLVPYFSLHFLNTQILKHINFPIPFPFGTIRPQAPHIHTIKFSHTWHTLIILFTITQNTS